MKWPLLCVSLEYATIILILIRVTFYSIYSNSCYETMIRTIDICPMNTKSTVYLVTVRSELFCIYSEFTVIFPIHFSNILQ